MPPKSSDTLEFMRAVWSLFHGMAVRSKRMQRSLGVSGPQRLVIRVVGRQPGIAASEIAAALDLHPSTLTGVLSRLESRGYLVRRADREDRRRARFWLTELGREVDALKRGTVEAAIRRALASLEDSEIETARAVLVKMAEELARETAPPLQPRARRRRA